MRICQITLLILFAFGNFAAHSQACEHLGSVEIRLQDENEKPVSGATIKFVDIPKGNALEGREFIENREPWDLYIATFCQSEILSKEKLKNGDFKQYDILVRAKGYRETKAKISIQHCVGSCLVNRAFVTIVNESAKLVTIKGNVKLLSSGYNDKGRLVSSEKTVFGAPIKFRRSTMVEFFTTSDADGNYKITVPAGAYGVYATAAPGCFMCAEYFGKIVGNEDTTVLNIILRFYGEG
jgi:hypothetical protein